MMKAWRDYRPRHCVACSGYRQKPRANERARCYVEPPVTVTPEVFLWLISITEGETTPETTRSHRSRAIQCVSPCCLKKRARASSDYSRSYEKELSSRA